MVELGIGQAWPVVPRVVFYGWGHLEKEVHGLMRGHKCRGEWFEMPLASILAVVASCIEPTV
jgi:hypothetical protein